MYNLFSWEIITYTMNITSNISNIKFRLLLLIVTFGIYSCSTTSVVYNPKEFDTINYQKNLDNAVDATDLLKDFDDNKIPVANLDTKDFANLIQADINFNQGQYAKAYSYYNYLARKYKDPRIIYKAIVCLEHISKTKGDLTQLHQMVNLFIEVNPSSKLAKLFAIKLSLKNNNINAAQDDLNNLMSNDPQTGRAILLFIGSLLTGDMDNTSPEVLTTFGDYVISNYIAYPEASLLAAISYADAGDINKLENQLIKIHQKFPNWDIPVIWSIGILSQSGQKSAVIRILKEFLAVDLKPDTLLQNIYVATLMDANQIMQAKQYMEDSVKANLNLNNSLINLGIINAKLSDRLGVVKNFTLVNTSNKTLMGLTQLSTAIIYDYEGDKTNAVKYYQQVINSSQGLAIIADFMLLNIYESLGYTTQIDQLLSTIAKIDKLDVKKTVLFKAGYYNNTGHNDVAYHLLDANFKNYASDDNYLYQYASTAAMASKNKLAIKLYNLYIKRNPNNAYGYNDLAFIYADQTNQYKLAYKYATKAIMLSPSDPNVLDTLGWVYYKQKQYILALKYIKASLDISYSVESAKHLRDVYIALGQNQLAQQVLIVDKNKWQQASKLQLLNKSIAILMLLQFGIDIK